jgi:hypothetical protein
MWRGALKEGYIKDRDWLENAICGKVPRQAPRSRRSADFAILRDLPLRVGRLVNPDDPGCSTWCGKAGSRRAKSRRKQQKRRDQPSCESPPQLTESISHANGMVSVPPISAWFTVLSEPSKHADWAQRRFAEQLLPCRPAFNESCREQHFFAPRNQSRH